MQDKTYIPGAKQRPLNSGNTDPAAGSLYNPSPEVVPGIYRQGAKLSQDSPENRIPHSVYDDDLASVPSVEHPLRTIPLQPRVLAGVLYSISKGLLGEIFPVYLGDNTLGKEEGCEIRLQEATVSLRHGYLQITRDDAEGTIHAIFTDRGSTYGSEINGVDARYETLCLNDGDILGIGLHYRLLFKIFDNSTERLYEDEEFQDTSVPPSPLQVEDEIPSNFNKDLSNDFYAPSGKETEDRRTVLY